MSSRTLVIFFTNDLAGMTRGLGFPVRNLDDRMDAGVGRVSTNPAPCRSGASGSTLFGPDAAVY